MDEKNENKKDKNEVNDPMAVYRKSRITFSTLETQGDVQLYHALSISLVERLELIRKLNDYAYKNIIGERLLFINAHIIFSSYEYLP
jgi:hypothetical protein